MMNALMNSAGKITGAMQSFVVKGTYLFAQAVTVQEVSDPVGLFGKALGFALTILQYIGGGTAVVGIALFGESIFVEGQQDKRAGGLKCLFGGIVIVAAKPLLKILGIIA